MTFESSDEKRAFKRVPAAAVMEIRPLESAELILEQDALAPAETLNLSSGGLLFSTDQELEVGSLISIKLRLDSIYDLNVEWQRDGEDQGEQSLMAIGKVIRVKGAPEIGYEVGIRFEGISEKDAAALRVFLRE